MGFSQNIPVIFTPEVHILAFGREKELRKSTMGEFQVWMLFAVLKSSSIPIQKKVRNCYIIILNSYITREETTYKRVDDVRIMFKFLL
jgi:hypothetical protein